LFFSFSYDAQINNKSSAGIISKLSSKKYSLILVHNSLVPFFMNVFNPKFNKAISYGEKRLKLKRIFSSIKVNKLIFGHFSSKYPISLLTLNTIEGNRE